MNKEWSALNKEMQNGLRRRDTYDGGIDTLLKLRGDIMDTLLSFRRELKREDFSAIPFLGAEGYHSKTIAYSIWHVFRIEDIVAHTLIFGDEQVFFREGFQGRTRSPIITTGNELKLEQIASFSGQLDLDELYAYALRVKESSDEMLRKMPYDSLKTKVPDERKARLQELRVVSEDGEAAWLIDYWCGKDVRGLIQMPFSRHWIMHTEACLRIKNKLEAKRK